MIERYARPEMTAIWSAASKYRIWFEIEAHGCDALAEIGVIPKSAAKNIWDRGGSAEFDVAKIDEIEREVKHDVIAFLTHLASFIGDDARSTRSCDGSSSYRYGPRSRSLRDPRERT